MKVALVHDWLNQIGGAEDVLDVLVKCYPESPIHTSIFAPEYMPERYRQRDIRPLWIDKMPAIHRRHQSYLPLYPLAWQHLDLSEYDVVLSNKSGFCHGLRADRNTMHICYCLTPPRYVWQLENYLAGEGISRAAEFILRPLVAWLKRWDYAAAQRVTHFIAISSAIQRRIEKFYQRQSDIIFPPVDTSRFQPVAASQVEDYFLVVSRLIPYKRIDLAVRAASELGVKLKVAGRGRDLPRLREMAGETVEFLGYAPDQELPDLMAKCRAFLFPGLEDFGITTVQAQSAGRPVIAFAGGGALDTVIPSLTGERFSDQTVASLKQIMADFDESAYDPDAIRRHALQFDSSVFMERITSFVECAWQAQQSGASFRWVDPCAMNEDKKPWK